MSSYCRELITDIQVERFVDGILRINDEEAKGDAINLITQAERNIKDYSYYPTLTRHENRDFKFRDNSIRKNCVRK